MSDVPELNLEPLRGWGFAPGAYCNYCSDCGKQHTSDKRAWRCLPCAEARADLHRAEVEAARREGRVAGLREAGEICVDRWASHMENASKTYEMDYAEAKRDANTLSIAANEATHCSAAILARAAEVEAGE